MRPFQYARPRVLAQLFDLLAEHGTKARILAGGTDVIVRLRMGHMRPDVVVDVKNVGDLAGGIAEVDGVLRVGARAVMTDLIEDARVRRHFPALVEAASVVGSVQIRNRATLAGNICNASPAADTAPALLVYGAVVNLAGAAGRRQVPLTEFFTGPGRTVLQAGEIVESIDLPVPASPAGGAFGRITRRYGVDLATINLCCRVDASGETRFAYGAVAPRPFLVTDTHGVLANAKAPAEEKSGVLRELIGHASPISDVRGGREYRLAMLDVMSRRALETAMGRLVDARGANGAG
jgi:CO/xanthine dehydrogenase FAD-binding subunit